MGGSRGNEVLLSAARAAQLPLLPEEEFQARAGGSTLVRGGRLLALAAEIFQLCLTLVPEPQPPTLRKLPGKTMLSARMQERRGNEEGTTRTGAERVERAA